MKKLKAIDSSRELIILVFVVIYFLIKRFPIPLIIMGTISLGICLYLMEYCINRLISKNNSLAGAHVVKKEIFEESKANRTSGVIDESKFKEEIRVLKKVIVYAESCSHFYNYKGSEAESFIDERCKPFIDLVTPLLAVFPNEYQLVIQTRPSLESYINIKTDEYIKNRPDLSDIKSELHKICNIFNFAQNNVEGNFNIDNATCAIIMINKYGFSQELFSVSKVVKPELYGSIFIIYDQRLRAIENHYDFSYECYKDPENASKLR